MRIRRPMRPSKEITGVFCTTCQKVCAVQEVETPTATTMFILKCGHAVMLTPGALCKLDVQADAIILYPNRTDFLVRQEATS